jgi:hypothetical protein
LWIDKVLGVAAAADGQGGFVVVVLGTVFGWVFVGWKKRSALRRGVEWHEKACGFEETAGGIRYW